MEEKKQKNPHRTKAIAWRDGEKKDLVVKCLNHPSVVAQMDDAAKANTGEMVLWAAKKIRELGMAGFLDVNQPKMFGPPEEVRGLEDRIRQLEELEDGYVKTLNEATRTIGRLEKLVAFYRKVARNQGLTVDEDGEQFREKYDTLWIQPA